MLNVALLQLRDHGLDQQANLEKGENACRNAQQAGADIALFPEMWNIGYTPYSTDIMLPTSQQRLSPHDLQKAQQQWFQHAIGRDSDFVRHFQSLARELDMAIGITYLEQYEPKPRNAMTLIDRHGEQVLHYAKAHTTDFSMEAACTPGEGFYVSKLDVGQGTVDIGAMICYDREFPESARALMVKGAEIILTPNACDLEQNRLAMMATRAYENMTGVAVTNYPWPKHNGHSVAYSGMAFLSDGSSSDHQIVQAHEEEGVWLAPFDLDAMRQYRRRETWGDTYRKPNRYHDLIINDPIDTFQRKDSRRD